MEVSRQDLIFMIILGLACRTLSQVNYWKIIQENHITAEEVCDVIEDFLQNDKDSLKKYLYGARSLVMHIFINYCNDDAIEKRTSAIYHTLENLQS